MTPVLVTIGPSHYCEKARWALQRAGVPFRETTRAPSRSPGETRVKDAPLLMADGEVIADTSEILSWVDKRTRPELRLIPDEARARATVLALEGHFDTVLGPHVWRVFDLAGASTARSLSRVRAVYREVDQRLEDGRRYLVGGRFTAADLTFAALAGPLLFPKTPDLVALSALHDAVAREFRATGAGRLALRLIREERG